MPDDSPLSLDSAAGLLIVNDAAPIEDKSADVSAAAPAAAETAATDTTPEPALNADGTPVTTDAPQDAGNADEGSGDRGDALPTIEPPSSWKAEEKAEWASLPRSAQEAIARREQDRTTELRNLQNSTAEQRKSAEAEVLRLKGLADKVSQYVDNQAANSRSSSLKSKPKPISPHSRRTTRLGFRCSRQS